MAHDRSTRHLQGTRRWAVLLAFVALIVAVTGGCGTEQTGDHHASTGPGADHPSGSTPEPDPGPRGGLALVATEGGLAGVPVGTSTPTWVVDGAVAAPDGSAVFALQRLPESEGSAYEVVRIDPSTGAEEVVGQPLAGPAGLHVAAVEPGGARVALAAPGTGTDRTSIIDFDTETGQPVREPDFEGTVEPEAYSVDRSLLFAARIYDDRYHVHALVLADGEQWPTLGPDKTVDPEDMYGTVVQAALSPDGTELATLYRDAVKPEHTAFVHLLSLETGTTVCIDLHEPFGGPDPGRDAIEWRDDGTVAVGHRAEDPSRSTTATFDPSAIWSGEPQPHYHADVQVDPEAPALPAGVADTPGFRRFVALASASATP